MTKLLLSAIFLYQNIFAYIVKNLVGVNNCCRFEVTCSEYAKISIEKYGVRKGGIRSMSRILSCQPFVKI